MRPTGKPDMPRVLNENDLLRGERVSWISAMRASSEKDPMAEGRAVEGSPPCSAMKSEMCRLPGPAVSQMNSNASSSSSADAGTGYGMRTPNGWRKEAARRLGRELSAGQATGGKPDRYDIITI